MKTYKTIEQGTPEWFEVRKLKLTASNAQAIGNAGKGLESLVTEMMAEYYSTAEKEHFTNKDTERGNELEEFAREMYELEKDIEVEQVGFIEENEYVGFSPDGLVARDGLVEFKSLNDVGHYKIIREGEKEIDTKYIWQTQMQLLISKRKWCDLVFYNPNFEKSLIIFRIEPNKETFEKLKVGIAKGIELIKNQLTTK
jgi:putative phage-type endonuclease